MKLRAILPFVVLAACGSHRDAPPPATTRTAAPAAPAVARVVDASFHSDALGVDKRYRVWLPASYDASPQRRYPVVYLLHPLSGNERTWTEHGKLAEIAGSLDLQALVVMPDADASFYANAVAYEGRDRCLAHPPTFNPKEPREDACVAHARYEDYVTRDLIAHVDATYRTIRTREARGLAGFSMGGYGALTLSMRHPDLFAAAASHAGVDALLYAGPHPYMKGEQVLTEDVSAWGQDVEPIGSQVRSILGGELANWKAHDPATLAGGLPGGRIALYLDVGTEDVFQLYDGARYLHDLLTARGVEHAWYIGPGGHDFAFVSDRLDDSLRWLAEHLAAPVTPPA